MTKDATSGALFFDGSAIPSDFTINEGDIYIFDTSDSSMAGSSIGFAGSKDNSGDDALGSSDGVTISGVPGSTGAKTTVQLAADYGDSAELHVFMAAEQAATPATVNVAVTSSSPFAFDTGSGPVTTLEFVDGNTYVFDLSHSSMAEKTLTIVIR